MARFICDFHIHSKYSRATSKDMDVKNLSLWAKLKGVDLLGTGDFTHFLWLEELKRHLKPEGDGLFSFEGTLFILTTEVSNIFSKGGKVRKIHNVIFAPSFEVAEQINNELGSIGNLNADGRPILGLEASELVKIVMGISRDCFIAPGHIWTPWFSLFGANSGFDRIEDCFEDQTEHIYALETGLSSDPAMNWRWSALDGYTLISNSDAHSPPRIGREANIFSERLNYYQIIDALKKKDREKFLATIEFFPQEGKYHWDGHRNCQVLLSPAQTRENGFKCPRCGRPVTVGVMHRVEKLADREEGFVPANSIPFHHLIPLNEIIAEAMGKGRNSQAVENEYRRVVQRFGGELKVLLDVSSSELRQAAPEKVAEGILRVREGKVDIVPGYDGVYGKIKIFNEEEKEEQRQLSLF